MFLMNTKSITARVAGATFFAAILFSAPTSSPAKEPTRLAAKEQPARPPDVEARITKLHSELKITREQEAAWRDVAQAMRENARIMDATRKEQSASETTESAPEMIDAYAKTVDTHATAIHKFSTVFQPLYDSMSSAQKKTADSVFRSRVREAAARGKS